jgi:hypothetical protein
MYEDLRGLSCIIFVATIVLAQQNTPKRAYVPDSETAVKIAEAVFVPVYGKSQTESERPFIATLKDNVWTVAGTLHCPDGGTNCEGGVATVRISKTDARIISMIHYE